jgi:hypothetical protein
MQQISASIGNLSASILHIHHHMLCHLLIVLIVLYQPVGTPIAAIAPIIAAHISITI